MYARNTLVQLLAAYTNPESHNAQHYRQTDRQQAAANSRSYCVAVRSANNTTIRCRNMSIKSLFVVGKIAVRTHRVANNPRYAAEYCLLVFCYWYINIPQYTFTTQCKQWWQYCNCQMHSSTNAMQCKHTYIQVIHYTDAVMQSVRTAKMYSF